VTPSTRRTQQETKQRTPTELTCAPIPSPRLPAAGAGKFVGMDLREPEIDFVGLAQSLGVYAERVSEPDELADKVHSSLTASDVPRLFDVPIARSTAGPGSP